MKHVFPILVSIAGAGAFLLGWSAGEPTSVAAGEATAIISLSSPASAEAGRPEIEPLAAKQLGGLTPGQARSRAFQILSVPDRLERMRQFSEFLLALTPENWTSIIDAFAVQRRSEGRTFREESSLMLDRIGEVCGIAAIDQAITEKIPNGRLMVPELLQGWAANDPSAAIAWFRARPADQQQELIARLIRGVGCSDPKTALNLVREVPENLWRSSTTSVIDGVIKVGGIQKADELYATVRNDPETPPALAREVLSALMDGHASIERRTGDCAALLAWFDPHFSPEEVAAGRRDPAGDLLATAFATNQEGTLAWLDARADRLEPSRAKQLYSSFGEQWAWRWLDQANRWLRSNPDHSQQAAIAGGAVSRLTDLQKFAEARQIVESVSEPEMRHQLTQQIEAAEEARNKAAARPLPK